MDTKDKQLLAELQMNARTPVSALARTLGLSRTATQQRLTKLEQQGVIAGYGVRFGEGVLVATILAYVHISVDPRKAVAIEAKIRAIPEVISLASISGSFDFIATVRCHTMEALDTILDVVTLLDGMKDTDTSLVLSRKFDRS